MHSPDPLLYIRPENANDHDFLVRLHRSTRDDLLRVDLPEQMLEPLLTQQFNAQQRGYRQRFPDAAFSIIEKQGIAIGQLIVHRSNTDIRLVYLALLPQHRRRGYGRSVLLALQEEAAVKRVPVRLSVSLQNSAVQRLYALLGWSVISNDGANLEMTWVNPGTPDTR